MDDPHRKPGDQERAALVARIKRAADDGRIAPADRDIRLTNVANAQSAVELDLIGRDLDQLEAAVPVAATPPPAWSGPGEAPVADVLAEKAVDAAKSTARSIGVVTIVLIALLGAGAAGVAGIKALRGTSDADPGGLRDPIPISQGPSEDPIGDPSPGEPSPESPEPDGPAYSLSGAGIRAFLKAYEERFATSGVVGLTLYGDYVVVDVPVPGKARHEGWLYRNGDGWTTFGGVTANFPGAQVVDTGRLAVPALMRNIARAQQTLNVEDPTTTYVIVRHYAQADEVPSVDIHVSNDFHESGYLATTLDGEVERTYPFGS